MSHADTLRALVHQTPWLMDWLQQARALALPDWYIGAGAIRNRVWDHLHGYPAQPSCDDIDLVYYQPEATLADEAALQTRLNAGHTGPHWEAVNQALVHQWYPARFGQPCPPLTSAQDGIVGWPETATAIGVRLEADDRLTLAAPCSLDDLFRLTLRWNPLRVPRTTFLQRLEGKQFQQRWPGLRVVE
ncbi:nucleotidyltransferase family protein [Leeia aquatica]|uniref:Nucleotidyltransferase family protein n=1 Tax=Leeia aquatica TaxID=2725557 RepID=A0A847RX06_9NEIS|nr:nucleotidyltransferase family protein [Leeia aquatica]NLR74311.1 nucleotidyltransferase family protein [Leeia aquatica]